MKSIFFNIKKNEKGFTFFELLIAVALVSVTLLSLFSVIVNINKADAMSKENNFAKQLIDVYISYYNDLEINSDNVSSYLSDVSDVNLVNNLRNSGGTVPVTFKNLDVVCSNVPSLIKVDNNNYILFTINCEKDGKKVNRGTGYKILKFIN